MNAPLLNQLIHNRGLTSHVQVSWLTRRGASLTTADAWTLHGHVTVNQPFHDSAHDSAHEPRILKIISMGILMKSFPMIKIVSYHCTLDNLIQYYTWSKYSMILSV